MTDPLILTLDEVRGLAERVLRRHGFGEAHAGAIARTLTAAERDECHHHGLFRLPFYVAALKSGQASGDAEPVVDDLAPGALRIDARLGFAPLALERGEEALAARAASQGIAALAINNANNVGPLWPEVEALASRGLVAFAFTSAIPYVAPAGGTKPLFGTNPMAFGWPRPDGPPLVFDQASSASARGEIQIRLRDGKTLPEGWAIGPDGEPTTDPKEALAGAQLPFGGAKGSSIALMIELLAGPLIGDVLSFEAGERDKAGTGSPCGGELILAMDPARLSAGGDRAAQLAHGERLFRRILDQDGTRLPSERRYAARLRTAREGVRIAPALRQTLASLGEEI
ncbi:Ldh family oxidoreductase [Enterovirga rhinocerotis]|uniref:LDH2 family malate/lactate/ureidoglycolate dehydrogenase n=1 Tax=Enterovirga rhinocerotis TaxID=1339210 RepID=A0A4R7BJB1_9HYPH|nr:Ldh family oxidoreductase [Enterovirga rhinocerotis]TDR85424.1 LDH2 family malate/lactate/ureidoglycolate dehydrogenase [Enterovirga rhinocerotis]